MHQPHPTAEELSAHRRRELPPGETLAVSDHLLNCAGCREVFTNLGFATRTIGVFAGEAPGVDYETFRAYLDGTLDPVEQEIMEADLRNHPGLAAQLEDLRRFRSDAEAEPEQGATGTQLPGNILPFLVRRRSASAAWWAVAASVALLIGAAAAWRWTAGKETAVASVVAANRHDVAPTRAKPPVDAALADSSLPAGLRAALREVLAGGALPASDELRALQGMRGALLDEPAAGNDIAQAGHDFALCSPVGWLVRETQPALRWTKRPGAAAYRVLLVRQPDGEIQRSPDLPSPTGSIREMAWAPAAPLRRGGVYEWQVQALGRGGEVLERRPAPPEPGARFQVLDAGSEEEMSKLATAHPQEHLLLALACARHGLLTDAETQLRALALEEPTSIVAQRLLKDLERQRMLPEAGSAPD